MANDSHRPIDLKFFLVFIPVAYGSYLFHELGHWSIGEILGNQMAYSLNYVWPKAGTYLHATDDLYVSMGGPAFSIVQAILALLVIEKYSALYAYPFAFFAMFFRFFSLGFGGFDKQDEARISAIMGIWPYAAAVVVLAILLSIVLRCSLKLGIGFKDIMYMITASTACQLMVIGTYKLLHL